MKLYKAIFNRIVFMALMAILEVVILIVIYNSLFKYMAWIETIFRILSVLVVLYIINNSRHLSSDLLWIIIIIIFPVFGTFIYILFGANLITSKTFISLIASSKEYEKYYKQDEIILNELYNKASPYKGQFNYISKFSKFPFYRNSDFSYYGFGEDGYPIMIDELKKAKKFIFLEYFIIEEGKMWNGILDILLQKVNEGVDVRIIYDDFGSFLTLSYSYAKKLEQKGIKCIPFNRVNPVLGVMTNHRDHRKLMVIDGRVAFSGGINLADEYINEYPKHGKWKDNIIKISGEAVYSYTLMFLTHFNAFRKMDSDVESFRYNFNELQFDGYIAPYGETPLDDEITAQNIYLNILNQSSEYCYIFTPYLIIDTEMINALILTAKKGVDVRIITPGIPDKKLVWEVTKSYYNTLIKGGVKIYEYVPGFVHSKVFLADDKVAVVGTVNLDYRSLYLHFENGTYLYDSKSILDIRKDFDKTFCDCKLIEEKETVNGFFKTVFISIIRLFAPLM